MSNYEANSYVTEVKKKWIVDTVGFMPGREGGRKEIKHHELI